jgi:FkbM family methyltransferase
MTPQDIVGGARRGFRRFLRSRGYDLAPFDAISHPDARRGFLIRREAIDLLIDVGANVGQFARGIRGLGYHGKMISYEPLSSAVRELEQKARRDNRWEIRRAAVGSECATATLHVAGNSVSSSIRAMLPAHADAAPESRYVAEEKVPIVRLDDERLPGERLYLKIDTQGYERDVLVGAKSILRRVRLLQFEASLVTLYQGELLWPELHTLAGEHGFVLAALESGFVDRRTGQLLQIEALYMRK